jgi:hypothetical protein
MLVRLFVQSLSETCAISGFAKHILEMSDSSVSHSQPLHSTYPASMEATYGKVLLSDTPNALQKSAPIGIHRRTVQWHSVALCGNINSEWRLATSPELAAECREGYSCLSDAHF